MTPHAIYLVAGALAMLLTQTTGAADFKVADHWPQSTLVFSAGRDHVIGHDDGVPNATAADMYQYYREPVVVRTRSGRLVCLCHAGNRHAWPERSGQDFAVTFSDDGGRTWSRPRVVAEHGNYSMQSHGLVYDAETDRVLCLYNVYQWDYSLIKKGRGTAASAPIIAAQRKLGIDYDRQYLVYSDDGGETWSKPRDISAIAPGANTVAHFGAAEGRQLTIGKHAGRLLLPGGKRHIDENGDVLKKDLHVWLSDDHGKTWRAGRSFTAPENIGRMSCEARITELPGGTLLYNERTRTAGRHFARSTDGGETWSPLTAEPELRASQCNGSMLTLRDNHGKLTRTVMCSLPLPGGRNQGVIYVSLDGGNTWPARHDLVPGFFAYSALVQIDADTIGLFYEANGYRDIRFMRVPVRHLLKRPATSPRSSPRDRQTEAG